MPKNSTSGDTMSGQPLCHTARGARALRAHSTDSGSASVNAAGITLALAVVSLLSGIAFYALFRHGSGYSTLVSSWPAPWLASFNALPSLLHAFATTLIAGLICGARPRRFMTLLLVLATILLLGEYLIGYTAATDFLFIALGIGSAVLWLHHHRLVRRAAQAPIPGSTLLSGALVGTCWMAIVGTGQIPVYHQPVYLSYQELRTSVRQGNFEPFEDVGRLYVYGDTVFLNERNQGIHVINNLNPILPVPIGFIHIPGNTELSIRDAHLYADSYVDLVTLDISDLSNIIEVNRLIDIFPYDERQNIPDDISLDPVNQELGVVVGYR